MGLFNKAICFTDIHFGLKNNSVVHNEDCLNFIDWIIDTAKNNDCETGIFLGDWHHNRSTINLHTLDYSLKALEKLNDAFENFYFIVGNHDLYYKDKRDVHGVSWAKHLPNVKIVDEWFVKDDVSIIPWLVNEDYKKISKIKSKYVFGHFELPHFKMNANVEMPDTGEIQSEQFSEIDYVFSGHFHMRQQQNNIHYIGNCFPHNYSDDGDKERGCMVLEWDKKPQYYNWGDMPSYKTILLSELLSDAEKLLEPKMHVRVMIDVEISFEESTFIKETFVDQYQLRELSLIQVSNDLDANSSEEINLEIQSVDEIVYSQLQNIESESFDKKRLVEIYDSL